MALHTHPELEGAMPLAGLLEACQAHGCYASDDHEGIEFDELINIISTSMQIPDLEMEHGCVGAACSEDTAEAQLRKLLAAGPVVVGCFVGFNEDIKQHQHQHQQGKERESAGAGATAFRSRRSAVLRSPHRGRATCGACGACDWILRRHRETRRRPLVSSGNGNEHGGSSGGSGGGGGETAAAVARGEAVPHAALVCGIDAQGRVTVHDSYGMDGGGPGRYTLPWRRFDATWRSNGDDDNDAEEEEGEEREEGSAEDSGAGTREWLQPRPAGKKQLGFQNQT